MASSYFQDRIRSPSELSSPSDSIPPTPTGAGPRSSALSSRITSVLSTSYADLEIRDALETLDSRKIQNTAETRRQLRIDVQKEVIQCNAEIVKDFGAVAEVVILESLVFFQPYANIANSNSKELVPPLQC